MLRLVFLKKVGNVPPSHQPRSTFRAKAEYLYHTLSGIAICEVIWPQVQVPLNLLPDLHPIVDWISHHSPQRVEV